MDLHSELQKQQQIVFGNGFLRTREVGEFISSALAGAMAKAFLAPLETIRYSLFSADQKKKEKTIYNVPLDEDPEGRIIPLISVVKLMLFSDAAAGVVSTFACHPLEALTD
ncbi:hypothetical protein Nepgr_005718 [Nepenthes gracilis]|uniref:Uncharacterized protein n=1 Tax=Nepenthes gracilis TaxID=150966 RepID=A0AAD3S432_NEPGR|nr:hypothetical protein Nepgr_005718 [Nepenthes gracilis]